MLKGGGIPVKGLNPLSETEETDTHIREGDADED